MALTPEGRVKKGVVTILQLRGCWYFAPVSNGMGRHGIPDIIACVPYTIKPEDVGRTVGLFAGIETKAQGKLGNVSALQRKELREIAEARGLSTVVDSDKALEAYLTEQLG